MYRRLNTAELEISVLKDSSINLGKKYSCIKGCGTAETSGHFLPSKATATQVSLLPHIKLICRKDLSSPCEQLGEGRFGKCYVSTFSHFMVCTKVFKKMNNSAFIHEANHLPACIVPRIIPIYYVAVGSHDRISKISGNFKLLFS